MLVKGGGGAAASDALQMLASITDANLHKAVLKQIATEMAGLEPSQGLAVVQMLPGLDQAPVLGEWIVGMIFAGKLDTASQAAQALPTGETKEHLTMMGLVGQVAHGQKTIAEAVTASGKAVQDFLPYVAIFDWSRVKDLDPNVAMRLISSLPPSPPRGGIEIGLVKNFVKQRRFQVADAISKAMINDLGSVDLTKMPGGGVTAVELASALAGVGRFDMAKGMFMQGLADRRTPLNVETIKGFFEALINADGGDLADRLTDGMPEFFQMQVASLWAKYYIKHDQPDQVRALLAKQKSPEGLAWLYIGVAQGLRELADKGDGSK